MNFSNRVNGFGKVLAVALVITLIFFAGIMTERYIVSSPELARSETVPELGGMEGAGYIIFKGDSTYYAKNGKTGAIDYSGKNATQIINNAINALPSTGGKIVLKEGTYSLSMGLTLKSHMILSGSGISNTILRATSNMAKILDIADLNYVTISDLWLDGDDKATDGIACAVDHSGNCIKIVRVRISDMTDDGIFNGGGSGTEIISSYIHGCAGDGVDADGGAWIITDSIITYNGEGITVFAEATVQILGGVVSSSTSNGIRIANTKRTTIIGVTVADNGGVGVYIQSNTTVLASTIKNNGNHQIYLGSGSNGSIINANEISDFATNFDGVRIQGIYDVTVTNNIFFNDDGGWGIQEGSGSDYNIIIGNNARDLTKGIKTVGTNTKVNLSWNGTNWIS